MSYDVTYFILNYNPQGSDMITPKFEECVHALYRNSDPSISKEVIVIDQGSPSHTMADVERLRSTYKFTLVQQPRNIGISAGINLGFRMGRGKVLCLVTYDVIVTKGFDVSCLELMKDDSIYHVVPLSNVGDNPFQVGRITAPFGQDDVRLLLSTSTMDAGLVELTVNFFSRKAIEKVGFFDERWMACYENMDYIWRTLLAGGRTVINRGAYAWHYHNTASKYVGRNHFYDGVMVGDPFADGRINNLWLDKWGQDINKDTCFDSFRVPAQQIINKYRQSHADKIHSSYISGGNTCDKVQG